MGAAFATVTTQPFALAPFRSTPSPTSPTSRSSSPPSPGAGPPGVDDRSRYPLVRALLTVPARRSSTATPCAVSFVYVLFEDGTDPYSARWSRPRVSQLRLPAASRPRSRQGLRPDATGVGWVYQYVILAKDKTWRSCATCRTGWSARGPRRARASPKLAAVGGFVQRSTTSSSTPTACARRASPWAAHKAVHAQQRRDISGSGRSDSASLSPDDYSSHSF